MRLPLAAVLPALALTLALAPDGAGEAPPQLGAAIAEQRNLVSARPSDAGVWNDLGNLLVLSGNLDEADGAYGRALELDPGSVQARFNLGLLRQQRGDLDGAVSRVPRRCSSSSRATRERSISSAPPTKPRASASSRSSATPTRSRSIPSSCSPRTTLTSSRTAW